MTLSSVVRSMQSKSILWIQNAAEPAARRPGRRIAARRPTTWRGSPASRSRPCRGPSATAASISRRTPRAKVEKAARELGYSPSQIARSLITQRSRMIGVVMTELTARNYPDVLLYPQPRDPGDRQPDAALRGAAGRGGGRRRRRSPRLPGRRHHLERARCPARPWRPPSARACRSCSTTAPRSACSASAVACDHPAAMDGLVDHLVAGGLEPRRVHRRARRRRRSATTACSACATRSPRAASTLERVVHGDYSYDGGRAIVRDRSGGRRQARHGHLRQRRHGARRHGCLPFRSRPARARTTSPSPASTTCRRRLGRPTS